MSAKGLTSRILYKELLKVNRKTNDLMYDGAEDSHRHVSKEVSQKAPAHMQRYSVSLVISRADLMGSHITPTGTQKDGQ